MRDCGNKPFEVTMNNPICFLYVVYDSVSGMYGDIFQAVNDSVVKRQFTNIFKNSVDKVPVADLSIVRLAQVVPSEDPIDIWPIINMTKPVFVLKGCDIDYDQKNSNTVAPPPDHSVPENV